MKIFITALLQLFLIQLSAQYTFFTPKESFAIEVSLDNSPLKRLPIYRNAISTLIVTGDRIIGGTSADKGLTPFIFIASLSKRELSGFQELNTVVTGQRSISAGFCKGANNRLYAGTIPNKQEDGGHLISLTVAGNGAIDILDLGVPVPGEGIFSLVADNQRAVLYGISYPTGIFFSYTIATKAVQTYQDIVPTRRDRSRLGEYVLAPEEYLCKALTVSPQGLIYGSLPVNKLFYFDPKDRSFHKLTDEIPEVWGRRSLGQVEAWTKTKEGKLYGGNAGDGQLFELSPVTNKIKNLGKPVMTAGLRGLTFGKDGRLYGIAGAASGSGYAHLFSYAPDKEGYRDYGNPQFTMKAPGIEQGIDWRGFRLSAITSSEDGKYIVIGEEESLSQLLVFAVEDK